MAEFVLVDPNWTTALALLAVLLVILGVVAVVAGSKRVFFKMALRNAFRRPSQTTMVVLGLMVGTAILSAALVASDSMEYWIVEEIYSSEDLIDEWVGTADDRAFDYAVYEGLVADEGVGRVTDGLSPMVLLSGTSINNLDEGQTESGIDLMAMDFDIDRAFGTFVTTDGERIDGTGLGPYEAIVPQALAKKARIEEGDTIMLVYMPLVPANATRGGGGQGPADGPSDIHYTQLTVAHVVRTEGKAGYNGGMDVFVTLGTAQDMLASPGMINAVKVSNRGGVVEGVDLSDEAVGELEVALAGIAPAVGLEPGLLEVVPEKEQAVKMAEEAAGGMKDFLVMASSFTVIAGTLLIINIFTMLAEERKKELGISRAIGMKRGSLVRTFTFEGVVYGLVAAGLGTLTGLVIGWLLTNGMFSAFAEAGSVPFYFKTSSLVIAFSVGALITIATVGYSSWRGSKLNIVRSIRAMEEPRLRGSDLRSSLQGGAVLAFGLLLAYLGFAPGGSVILQALGPNLAIIGAGLTLRRWLSREAANTAMGLGVLAYSVWGLFSLEANEMEGMLAIVVVGLMLVGGSVLALVSNSRPLVRGIGWLLSKTPRGRAIASPAIAHPLNKGFRTGMTIAMFGLIIYIVVLFSIFFSIFAPDIDGEKGGYDLMATSSVPIDDLRNITFAGDPTGPGGPSVNYTTLDGSIAHVDALAQFGFWGNFRADGREMATNGPPYQTVYGVDDTFAGYVQYTLSQRSGDYASDREAWMAVTEDPDLCIIDVNSATDSIPVKVGTVITLPEEVASGGRNYTVIGVADVSILRGIFVQKEALVADIPTVRGSTLFMLAVSDGQPHGQVAKDLEADMSAVGMDVVVLEEMIEEFTEGMDQMFKMFSLFMALGLVVGVASLGVLAIRSVIERKQEIGIMRAIGYKRGAILGVFSTEMLFVTVMGILIGLGSGMVSGYGIWKTNMSEFEVDFSMPWDNVALVVAITLVAAVVCTFIPAYKASRTNPAEAVRWVE